jgi:hypothetical protein
MKKLILLFIFILNFGCACPCPQKSMYEVQKAAEAQKASGYYYNPQQALEKAQ